MVILPIQGAKWAVQRYPHKLNVISVERETPVDASLCKHHLQLDVDDLDFDDPAHRTLPAKYKFATKEDILRAADFAKKYKVHIIHCAAGVSRSPAIAYAILRSQGMSKDEAMKEVFRINPHSHPNPWIVKLTDEIFGGIIKLNNIKTSIKCFVVLFIFVSGCLSPNINVNKASIILESSVEFQTFNIVRTNDFVKVYFTNAIQILDSHIDKKNYNLDTLNKEFKFLNPIVYTNLLPSIRLLTSNSQINYVGTNMVSFKRGLERGLTTR